MACYLIAGASGYTGARFAQRLLAQGHKVRGLVRDAEEPSVADLAARGMVVWTGDITQAETLVGIAEHVDYVYNLTSCSILSNGTVRRTFVEGNQNLIAAASRARSVRSYLFTSNTAPYGDGGDSLISEDAPVVPLSPFGEVMAEAERTIMELVRRHHFPAMILRVGTIYGPDRDPIDAVRNGTITLFGDGRNFVPHIHIDDLLTVLELTPQAGVPGAIYNVVDDEPLRQFEIYSEIRQRLGMIPPRTFSREVALQSGIDPSIVSQLSASVRASNARLRHDFVIDLQYPSMRAWVDAQLGVAQELSIGA
jgi:nucleoside-diphosphate-sugar epimerase